MLAQEGLAFRDGARELSLLLPAGLAVRGRVTVDHGCLLAAVAVVAVLLVTALSTHGFKKFLAWRLHMAGRSAVSTTVCTVDAVTLLSLVRRCRNNV